MELELVASNAKLVEEDASGSVTIWARDPAGNEISLVLNARLNKRILATQVNDELSRISNDVLPILMDNLREMTTEHERALHAAHSAWFADIRRAIKGKEISSPSDDEPDQPSREVSGPSHPPDPDEEEDVESASPHEELIA